MPDNNTIQKVINTTFQLKRGNAAEWFREVNGEIESPVLKAGEPGVELDTHRMKVGDGTTPWANLPYIGGTGGNITDTDIINIITNSNNLQDKIIDVANSGAITTNNLASIIASSNTVQAAIADIIQDSAVIHFKGEAISADIENNKILKLYDNNLTEITPSAGDVYLYQGNEYVYDNTAEEWILLSESSYNSTNDLVTQDEFRTLQQLITEPTIATENVAGVVKSASLVNTISVNSSTGVMTVNDISIEKLVVPTGVELVLDGGTAT